MKIVIKIDDSTYKDIIDNGIVFDEDNSYVATAIMNGTPLPKRHGRLKDIDTFIAKVQADRQHAIYTRSWTADDVLDALSDSYTPTIIEADGGEEDDLKT